MSIETTAGVAQCFECEIEGTPEAEALLAHLDATGVLPADHVGRRDGTLHVVFDDNEIDVAESHGLQVIRGSALVVRDQRVDGGGMTGLDGIGTGFVNAYLDAAQIAARVANLAATFPALCSVTTLPELTSGYDGATPSLAGPSGVQLLRLTTTPAVRSKPGFLLIGGTHAREWLNPLIALELAQQLLSNYDPASSDPEVMAITRIVDEGDVLIVPVLNPDGLNYSIHDDAGWRKSRRPNPAPACPGVDNNRNYEVYFGGAGSSPNPCGETYHGASAFSEAENRNIRHVLEQFPNVLVGVDAHSSGPQILRPSQTGGSYIASEPVSDADDAIYSALETVLFDAIHAVNGTAYALGSTSNHAGTSDEYMFFGHRVFGFNTECATSFQPLWPGAGAVIAEVTAGLRALALATLDLDVTTTTPLRVAQCIDATGSMLAFGFDGPARANARRFVDLMSLGDSVAIVSFADPSPDPATTPEAARAHVELGLTVLDDPGDAAVARAAVDAISFGGWTPIGAGLLAGAAQLAGASDAKAILLLSDGYENRAPTVAGALSAMPDLRVFTIALGPAADATVLQSIATQTGGTFHLSPTALDLHLVYNQMRADMTDSDLVLNDAVPAQSDGTGEHAVAVEPAVDRLVVSVSTNADGSLPVEVRAPSGRVVCDGDWGTTVRRGAGYVIVEILRPAPGSWRVTCDARDAHVVAAFVDSPLCVDVRLAPIVARRAGAAKIEATFEGRRLQAPRVSGWSRSTPLVRLHDAGETGCGATRSSDALSPQAARRIAVPVAGRRLPWHGNGTGAPLPAGFSQLQLSIDGTLPGGATYRRVALRTVYAA